MKTQLGLLLTLSVFSMTACYDEPVGPVTQVGQPNSGASKKVSISSIHPKSGPVGSVVAIFGENFGPTNSDNNVTFGGEFAEVTDTQSALIVVRVPMGLTAGNYSVNISANGGTAQSTSTFEVSTKN